MPNRDLTITVQPHLAGPCVLTVTGELDYHTAPRLRDAVNDLPCGVGTALIIDLSGLSYCDSTGISVMVTAYRQTQAAKVPLALTGLDPHIAHVFHIVGLDRIFAFYDSVDQAAAALAP